MRATDIRRVEIRIVPVRGKTKTYSFSKLTQGVQSFAVMQEMMWFWMRQMDRQARPPRKRHAPD